MNRDVTFRLESAIYKHGLLPYMLKNAGITPNVYRCRRARGASMWEALEGPRKPGRKAKR